MLYVAAKWSYLQNLSTDRQLDRGVDINTHQSTQNVYFVSSHYNTSLHEHILPRWQTHKHRHAQKMKTIA